MNYIFAGQGSYELNRALEEWCSEEIWGTKDGFGGETATLGVFDTGHLQAVIVYNNYDPDKKVIEYSGAAASKRWLTKETLRQMFSYPFDQLGCERVVTTNAKSNKYLHKQLKRLSHKCIGETTVKFSQEPYIIWELTKADWLKSSFNTHRKVL